MMNSVHDQPHVGRCGITILLVLLIAACSAPPRVRPSANLPMPAHDAAPMLASALANVLTTCGYLDADVDPKGVSEILPREYMRDAAEAAAQQLTSVGLPDIAARITSTYEMTPKGCYEFVTGPLRDEASLQFERLYGQPVNGSAR